MSVKLSMFDVAFEKFFGYMPDFCNCSMLPDIYIQLFQNKYSVLLPEFIYFCFYVTYDYISIKQIFLNSNTK